MPTFRTDLSLNEKLQHETQPSQMQHDLEKFGKSHTDYHIIYEIVSLFIKVLAIMQHD